MLDSDPFSPLLYWPHVILGIASVGAVLVAIFSTKGSALHRSAGIAFSVTMGVAALTAILFSLWRLAPPAIFSALSVIYGIGMGILSLRIRSAGWRALQWVLVLLPLCLAVLGVVAVASLFFVEEMPAAFRLVFGIPASVVVIFLVAIVWHDIRFLRSADPSRFRRLQRHALRMAIAGAEVVRAPLISFGPPLGPEGVFSFPLYFFGPFFLIPLIYYFAMPSWIRSQDHGHPRASLAS